ncbi:MAG: hypothetical protein A4E67_01940 [Syntrophaceae bacterium PtaB.Bin038]|nr:MAG: hypothetical protein A4E67_01940 [Syntrophaceae bacterium PtaB.Bin038]
MVATNRGPFLSTRVPPKAAARPMTAMLIIMVAWTGVSPQPWVFIRGILKTDQA